LCLAAEGQQKDNGEQAENSHELPHCAKIRDYFRIISQP
jgi:hypothetical protein